MTHETKMLTFCTNIRTLRSRHGLSKQTMAHVLGIGVNTLNALESDVVPRRLSSSVLIRAAAFFEMSTDALFLPLGE